MLWSDFLLKIKYCKDNKITSGVSASGVALVLFSGGFDSMLENPPKYGQMLTTYLKMFEDYKKASGSKAELPKKNKTQLIGLQDVKSDRSLVLWRFIVNPVSKFDFVQVYKEQLRMIGLVELDLMKKNMGFDRFFTMESKGGTNHFPLPTYLTKSMSYIFNAPHPNSDTICKRFTQKERNANSRDAAFVGVVISKRKIPYGAGQHRMVINFYNGYETINVIVWPDYKTRLLPNLDYLKPMSVGVMTVRPNLWKGNGGCIFERWSPLND